LAEPAPIPGGSNAPTAVWHRDYRGIGTVIRAGSRLNKIDWICGSENNDDLNKVRDCFTSIVRHVSPWVKLDVIRKYCGVSLAKFIGNETLGLAFQVADPKRCVKEGGAWGVKSEVSVPGLGR
jgi:hypothetical protein